jgi:hypothetical protein
VNVPIISQFVILGISDGGSSYISGGIATVGKQVSVKLKLTEKTGQPLALSSTEVHSLSFVVEVANSQQISSSFSVAQNGEFLVTFTPNSVGDHGISVRFGNEILVKNIPLKVEKSQEQKHPGEVTQPKEPNTTASSSIAPPPSDSQNSTSTSTSVSASTAPPQKPPKLDPQVIKPKQPDSDTSSTNPPKTNTTTGSSNSGNSTSSGSSGSTPGSATSDSDRRDNVTTGTEDYSYVRAKNSDPKSTSATFLHYLPPALAVLFGIIGLALLIAGGTNLSAGGSSGGEAKLGGGLLGAGVFVLILAVGMGIFAYKKMKENETALRL